MTTDNRSLRWSDIEDDVQARAYNKDSTFRLSGSWKRFIKRVVIDDIFTFNVYAVDGDWIRNNLSVIFGHGGHGLVHEFIPIDEIWIADRHPDTCECKGIADDREVSARYFHSTQVHEITEFLCMRTTKAGYWEAHQVALQREILLGYLKDPFTESYTSLDDKLVQEY